MDTGSDNWDFIEDEGLELAYLTKVCITLGEYGYA
jgi:hypothetical protein